MLAGETKVEQNISYQESVKKNKEERFDYLTWCIIEKVNGTEIILSEIEREILKEAIRAALQENISTMKGF